MAGWEEELGLDNVRPFDRPMTAGKNDKVVGQDELGQTIYETPTGQRYTVRPATEEESKTTRAKVEDWVDEGSPLPSWDQVVEAAKNAPIAAYNSVADMVRGQGTYGDVMGAVATMAAPGATKAFDAFDPNTTRMFFGPDSPKADLRQLVSAKRMTENGYTPEEVWRSTGWWNSPNGWRFEIDDSQADFDPNFMDQVFLDTRANSTKKDSYLNSVVDHREFEDALVTARNPKLSALNAEKIGGYFSNNNNLIHVEAASPKELREVLLHEMQHLEQRNSDTPSKGANNQSFVDMIDKTLQVLPREALEYLATRREIDLLINDMIVRRDALKNGTPKGWEGTELDFLNQMDLDSFDYTITELKRQRNQNKNNFASEFGQDFKKTLDDLYTLTGGFTDLVKDQVGDGVKTPVHWAERANKLNAVAYDLYERNIGEAEARLTQKRKDYSPQKRAEIFPENDYDVPKESLIDEIDVVKVLNNMLSEWDNVKARKGYAKGGMVENPSMDPVSGNPVPAGAKPEEVRDDVPIMASEGEYVIPANVVRFLGLDRIERMVSQAKEKLQEMEDKGRIGGQTEDDLPFSAEELLTLEESQPQAPVPQMATGGMVQDPNNDIDPATGLPRWLVSLQNAPVATPAVPQAPQPAIVPTQSQTSTTREKSGDRFKVEQENNRLTGMAQAVKDWTPKEFNQYARTRNSVDQKVGQAMASVIPLGGLMARARERHLERAVPREIDNMLKTGRDLQGNPLTEEQRNQLRQTRQTLSSERISQVGGIPGVVQAVARETGILPSRQNTPQPSSSIIGKRGGGNDRPAPERKKTGKEEKSGSVSISGNRNKSTEKRSNRKTK